MRSLFVVVLFTVAVLVGSGNCQTSSNSSKCIDGPFSDVKKAWNAANNQILLHGEYPLIFNESTQQEGFLEPTGICVPNPDSYKFPSPSSPEIARIIQDGVMKFGQSVFLPFNATTQPEDYRYVQRILFYFNQHYKSNVTIETINTFESSNAVFAAMERHEIDVVGPPFSLGVFIDNVPRNELFQPACPMEVFTVPISVSEKISASNWTEFKNVYILDNTTTAAEKPKVGTESFGDYLTAKGIFAGFDVIFFEDDASITASYENGTIDILWDFAQADILDLAINRTTHSFLTDVVSANGVFFNYDKC